jgi:hypothetical protein
MIVVLHMRGRRGGLHNVRRKTQTRNSFNIENITTFDYLTYALRRSPIQLGVMRKTAPMHFGDLKNSGSAQR